MSTWNVTVQVDAPDRDKAKALLTDAGFGVSRVTGLRTRTSTDVARPDSRTDRPDGLTLDEARAYVRGYAAAALRYAKSHGIPAAGSDLAELRDNTAAYERDRHPTCHRAGMRELQKWQGWLNA